MQIVGVRVAGGKPSLSLTLPHGANLHRLLWEQGWSIVRLLSVSGTLPDLTLTLQIAHHSHTVTKRTALAGRVFKTNPQSEDTAPPILRQRIAVYGIIQSPLGLLATQFSKKTAVSGLWGLPGGGMNIGETPNQTLVREIAEETGQEITAPHLLDIQTDHWIGSSPAGVREDFHAVRIIYAGNCPDPTTPQVHDIGGTTSNARWVKIANWKRQSWTSSARTLLWRNLPALLATTNYPATS